MSQTKWIVNEDGDFCVIGRATNIDGTLVTQATVSSIDVEVSRLNSDGTFAELTLDTTATVADTIYDTAQTNETIWPSKEHPGGGYNVLYTVPASAVPAGGFLYQVWMGLTTSTGKKIPLTWDDLYCKKRYGDD